MEDAQFRWNGGLNPNLGVAYSGIHASIPSLIQSATALKPPNKSPINEVMQKCVGAAEEKEISFMQLKGDHAVCTLSKEVKMEGRNKEKKDFKPCEVLRMKEAREQMPTMIFQRRVISGIC